MDAFEQVCRFFLRFRYPVSLPEDIAQALGLEISNYVTFDEFIHYLTSDSCKPTRLTKFMQREKAEEAFKEAQCKECFKHSALFSFYFAEGWVEFVLEFDDHARLRRLYLNHKTIQEERGTEIILAKETSFLISELEVQKSHFISA